MADDLIKLNPKTALLEPASGFTPSPIVEIDGVDVVTFLLEQSLTRPSQDPDALWNQVFYQLGRNADPTFIAPSFYPGPHTNLTFSNGTTKQFPNKAIVNIPLDGLATGEEAYSVFCAGAAGPVTSTTAVAATSTVPTETEQETETTAPPPPNVPFYPYPVIKHSANSVAGYYLNSSGYTDVAILKITEFQSSSGGARDYQEEFQDVVEKFLAAAVRSKKRKLIIDLQGNGGTFQSLKH